MTIGVTGGAGYIGQHLVHRLLEFGHRVRVIDSMLYGEIKPHAGLEILRGDICDVRAMSRFVEGCEVVVALAAIVGDAACAMDERETRCVNHHATALLVHLCEESGCGRIVFASSCSVYGHSADANEGTRPEPVSLYAETRLLSEKLLLSTTRHVHPVILRLATVFGWSARMRFDLAVNLLTGGAVCEGALRICGGKQWRPFVHCRDAARAFDLAATLPEGRVAGEVFNVGGENRQILDLGEIVREVIPGTDVRVEEQDVDRRDYRVNFDKVRGLLGFAAEYSIGDGVREIAEELGKPGAPDYREARFHNVRCLSGCHG